MNSADVLVPVSSTTGRVGRIRVSWVLVISVRRRRSLGVLDFDRSLQTWSGHYIAFSTRAIHWTRLSFRLVVLRQRGPPGGCAAPSLTSRTSHTTSYTGSVLSLDPQPDSHLTLHTTSYTGSRLSLDLQPNPVITASRLTEARKLHRLRWIQQKPFLGATTFLIEILIRFEQTGHHVHTNIIIIRR